MEGSEASWKRKMRPLHQSCLRQFEGVRPERYEQEMVTENN